MRKLLVLTVFALAALGVGVSAGALAASEPATPNPAAAPTTTNPLEFLASLGLTNEQIGCLVANGANLDTEDLTQMMNLMMQCGIDVMDLVANMGNTATTVVGGTPSTTIGAVTLPATIGSLDPADIRAVLTLIGLSEADIACLATGLQATSGADDEALTVLQGCGLSLDALLLGIINADTIAGGGKPDVTATTLAVAVPPTTVASSGDPMVDMIQQQLAALGITLTNEQVQCIVSNLGDADPNDPTVMMNVLTQCGVSLSGG